MTKSTITRERLQELAEGQSGFNLRTATHEESQELARMALAAMDSEPVAEVLSNRPGNDTSTIDRALPVGTQLYRHAQPAPVVMAEAQSRAAFEQWCTVNIERNKWHPEFYAHLPAREQWAAWNACRAAMLAAAPQSPGSEPATMPGKWIPVSERMPEDRTQVILWDAEIGEVTSGHYSHKTQTFYHCGDAIENEITHWMLPPSAPQGVKP